MRFAAFAILVLLPALGAPKQHSSSPEAAIPTEVSNLCKPEFLPEDIQSQSKEKYSTWKVQEPDNLKSNARERWESEKPLQCPGVVMGHFDNAKATSYAVFLVPGIRSMDGYKLLVFSAKPREPSFGLDVLDQASDGGSGNFFIRTVKITKFFDEKSKEKFQVVTDEAILFVNAGESEYETDVFFLSKDGYKHEPVLIEPHFPGVVDGTPI